MKPATLMANNLLSLEFGTSDRGEGQVLEGFLYQPMVGLMSSHIPSETLPSLVKEILF